MLSKIRLAAAALQVLRNPDDTEKVFVLLDEMMTDAHQAELTEAIQQHPRGAEAMRRQPSLGAVDVAALAELPEGTLGKRFASFLQDNGLDPALLTDEGSTHEDYVTRHLLETHDVWHVVTGMGSDLPGEVGLQAFYMAQLPGAAGGLIISLVMLRAALFSKGDQHALLESVARGWQLGRSAEPLAGMPWADQWETPLSEIRSDLRLDVA
ncbi:MAG: ubiquinone biosynthesis protein COQ4 [Myxococcota bacterium]|jgi:ubiquinone biosynthesis protein COQ4